MEHKIGLPDTDLSVSLIGLGTSNIGLNMEEKEADRLLDGYLELGGNLIDTAHVYSNWVLGERARSERVIGDWIGRNAHNGKREQIVLMTKGGHPEILKDAPEWGKVRPTHGAMVNDLNHSLQKLQTDYIDIYFYHRDNRNQTIEEEIETMEGFVKEGKIRYYGCSNFDTDRMEAAMEYCKAKGYRGFVADQSLLNIGMKSMKAMSDPTLRCIEGASYVFHKAHPELTAMPYSGNCNGYFQRYLLEGEEAVKGMPYDTQGNRKVALQVKKITEKYGCTVTQAVMGYFRFQPFLCIPLFGTSSLAHLRDVWKSLEVSFTQEDYEGL